MHQRGENIIRSGFIWAFILVCIPFGYVFGKEQTLDTLISSVAKKIERSNDPEERLSNQIKLANIYFYREYNLEKSDSILNRAILDAESTRKRDLIIKAYQAYMKIPDHADDKEHRKKILDKLIERSAEINDESTKFQCLSSICRACNALNQQCSDDYADRVADMAREMNDLEKQVIAFLLRGACKKKQKNWIYAFENFENAELLILELKEEKKNKYSIQLYEELHNLYYDLHEYKKALSYVDTLIKLEKGKEQIDSFHYYTLRLYEMEYSYYYDREFPVKKGLLEVLDFTERNHYNRLKNLAHSIYRQVLIERADLEQLLLFYEKEHPHDLEELRSTSPYNYHAIKAYLEEAKGNIDAATARWKTALDSAYNGTVYRKAHAHHRRAEFFKRNGDLEKAIADLEKAREIIEVGASGSTREDKLHDYYKLLKDYYQEAGNDQLNAKYTRLYYEFDQKIRDRYGRDFLLRLGAHESKVADKRTKLEKEKKEQKYKKQYWMILILVVFMLTILIIGSSMKAPPWVIKLLGFFAILSLVEFTVIFLDSQFKVIHNGEPLLKFIIKVGLFTFIYPLHHIIEHKVTDYMLHHRPIGKPSWKNFKAFFAHLWPWLREDEKEV